MLSFLLLSYKGSLYTLDLSPSADTWFANIFSYPVSCLFTFLMIPSKAQKLVILVSNLSSFSFVAVFLVSYLRNHCVSLCFLRVLHFCLLHLGLWSVLSSFLYMVWGRGPTSYFACIYPFTLTILRKVVINISLIPQQLTKLNVLWFPYIVPMCHGHCWLSTSIHYSFFLPNRILVLFRYLHLSHMIHGKAIPVWAPDLAKPKPAVLTVSSLRSCQEFYGIKTISTIILRYHLPFTLQLTFAPMMQKHWWVTLSLAHIVHTVVISLYSCIAPCTCREKKTTSFT